MYTFSIKKDHIPLVEISIEDDMIRENPYFQNLIEKCFEKVFQTISKVSSKDFMESSEEADLEEDD